MKKKRTDYTYKWVDQGRTSGCDVNNAQFVSKTEHAMELIMPSKMQHIYNLVGSQSNQK